MAVYIELTTDPFEQNFRNALARHRGDRSSNSHAGITNVRRPLRGMEIKEDTYGVLKVIRADGEEIPFMDSSSPSGESTGYSNFILQSVQESRMEKHQIIETFGDPYIYFFGEAPRFLDVQAVLVNSFDFNWQAEWWNAWELNLRGSKSVEMGARTYLFYDDNVVEGFMLMSQANQVSTEPFLVQMTFRMFVTSQRNVSFVGDPNFPVHSSVHLPPDISLTDPGAYDRLTETLLSEARSQDAIRAWGEAVEREADGSFGSRNRLTDLLRRGTRTIAFPADVQSYIDSLRASNAQDLPDLDVLDRLSTRPLRSKIHDNTDEYTQRGGTAVDFRNGLLPEVYDPLARNQLEVQDLFQEAINWMACFGAFGIGYQALQGVGLGVHFGAGAGIGVGLGGGVGIGGVASFAPIAQVSLGAGPPPVLAAGNPAFGPGIAGMGVDQPTPFSGQALGGVAAAGYPSPFGGVGFGVAGHGDMGGASFGSSFGPMGDPGYLLPDNITFAGVEDDRGAFDRMFPRRPPAYGLGIGGVGVGMSSPGVGGASVLVGGNVTAFGITVVPGDLDITGRAPRNPFNVPCLDRRGGRAIGIAAGVGGAAGVVGGVSESVNLLDLV